MSKGSPIVPVRIPPLFLSMIDGAIAKANESRRDEPYNRTTWILAACNDKLKHLQRSKKKRKRGGAA